MDDIFAFTNFTQGNVLASAPHPAGPANTDANYSPLWQVSLVAWNPGYQGRVLKSHAETENAANAGEVTITKTPIIVECSVIFTPGAVSFLEPKSYGRTIDGSTQAATDK